MKTLRFPQHPFTRSATLAILFALFGWAATAQTISGKVFNECTGQPIAGAEVNISVNLPGQAGGSWTITTQVNGSWNFSFSGGDPNGPYIITVTGGAHAPGFYTYYRSEGSKKGLDFDLLPDVFDITINGEAVSSQNNPSNPHTVCQNAVNCVELVANGGVDGFEPNTDYCYKLYLYSTDASGNPGQLLAESACQNFSRPDPVNPCDPGFDLNALLHQAGQLPPVIRMEVRQFCCSSGCIPGEGTLVNTEVVFIEVLEIGPADADFKLVDGTVPFGVSDRSETRPGPSIGEATCGIFVQAYTSGNEIESYQVVLEEVDCQGPENAVLIHDSGILPAPNGDLPGTYGFNGPTSGYFLGPVAGWPSTANRCFKVTLTIFNPCGGETVSSYFTIDQNCQFCLIAPPNDGTGVAVTANMPLQGVEVYPNPVKKVANFRFKVSEPGNVNLLIHDNTGRQVQNLLGDQYFDTGIHVLSRDLSGLPSGVYTYQLLIGEEVFSGKLVK